MQKMHGPPIESGGEVVAFYDHATGGVREKKLAPSQVFMLIAAGYRVST